jgi:hypothetical protein
MRHFGATSNARLKQVGDKMWARKRKALAEMQNVINVPLPKQIEMQG